MEVLTAILSIVATLSPLVVKWLAGRLDKEDPRVELNRRHVAEGAELTAAVSSGDADAVAAAFARRDSVLQARGLGSQP